MPASQGRRHIWKYLAVELTILVTLKRDFGLNPFQCGRFSVLIHKPVEVRFSTFGPRRWVIAAKDIFVVFEPEIPDVCSLKKRRGAAAGEREENIVDERDWSRRAFNIEQYAARYHDTNERPRQTGSKRTSTPLSE